METPYWDFAVAENFVGEDTVDVDGEETVICAKPHADRRRTDNNLRERKLHTPGDRYVLVFYVPRNVQEIQLWRYRSNAVIHVRKIAQLTRPICTKGQVGSCELLISPHPEPQHSAWKNRRRRL